MRNSRRQREELAREKQVGCSEGDDLNPAGQGMDGDHTLGTVYLELSARLKGEDHQCHRSIAKNRDLPVSRNGRVALGPEQGCPGREIDELHWRSEALLGERAKSFRVFHGVLQD